MADISADIDGLFTLHPSARGFAMQSVADLEGKRIVGMGTSGAYWAIALLAGDANMGADSYGDARRCARCRGSHTVSMC